MGADQLGTQYEVGDGREAVDLIGEMTEGRIGPVYLRLWFENGGSETVIFERVHPSENAIDLERPGGEFVPRFSCADVVGVTRLDPSRPLDRSDEIR